MSHNKIEKMKEKKTGKKNPHQIENTRQENETVVRPQKKIQPGKIKNKITNLKDKAIDGYTVIVDVVGDQKNVLKEAVNEKVQETAEFMHETAKQLVSVVKAPHKEIPVATKARLTEFELCLEIKKHDSIIRKNTLSITMFEGYFYYETIGPNGHHYEGDIYSDDINLQIQTSTTIEEIKRNLEALGHILTIIQDKSHFPKHKSLEQRVDEIAVEDPDVLNDVAEVNAIIRANAAKDAALFQTVVTENEPGPPDDLPPTLDFGPPGDLPPKLDFGPYEDLPPKVQDVEKTLPDIMHTKSPQVELQNEVIELPRIELHELVTENSETIIKNSTTVESENRVDLMAQQIKFNGILKQLQDLRAGLILNEKKNPGKYTDVILAAQTLFVTLESNSKKFFENQPTPETFEDFKLNCNKAIRLAKTDFQKHRGIWNQIHPVIRGILGVLATLTLLPALIVTLTSKYGYVQTFFGTPKTDSAITLDQIKDKQEEIEDEMILKLGCARA